MHVQPPVTKRGCPFLLREKLDAQTQAYIQAIQDVGGVITNGIAIAASKAMVHKCNPGLIDKDNGPIIHLTANCAKLLLYRMGFVK